MSYMVTGAGGFIGRAVVRQLREQDEQVIALDAESEGLSSFADTAGVTAVHADVAELPRLADVIRLHRVDRIIHLAGLLHAEGVANPWACIRTNVVGTYNVLQAGRLLGVERTVSASSGALFGLAADHPGGVVPNDTPLVAKDLYEASKIFGEEIVRAFGNTQDLPAVSLRIGIVYGPGTRIGWARRLMDALVYSPMAGIPSRVPLGDDGMNWSYVDDAARFFIEAARRGPASGSYNVRGDCRTMREAVDIALKLQPGADIQLDSGGMGWACDFDASALEQDFGLTPEWTLERGLEATLDAARVEASGGTNAHEDLR